MRKPVTLALAAVIVLLAGATIMFVQKYRTATANYLQTKSAEEEARTQYAKAFSAIAEIQDSLNAISLGDSGLSSMAQGLNSEGAITEPNKAQALERIALLSSSVQRAKAKIAYLESNMKRDHVKINGMERLIASLKKNVASREEMVAQLSGRVDSLQVQVTGLQTAVAAAEDTVRQQTQTIEDKRRELATIEYIIADKKELTTSGIAKPKGGVLGVGKTLVLTGQFDNSRFSPLDTDQETVVRVPAKKVEILSPQPPTSYAVETVGTETEIHILNPTEFRKVKHLVIMTKA